MKYKLIYFIFILTSLLNAQNTVGIISIDNNAYDGYTLFTSFKDTYLINNCGEVINQWSSNFPPGNAVYLLENGNLLRAGRTSSTDITLGGQGGIVELYNWSGDLIWQYLYDTLQHRQHHDVFPMPNGNVLILAATVMSNTEAIQAGRNPNLLSESVLYNEQIIEVDPIGTNSGQIVWEWNIKDHLIQDFDNTKANFGDVSLSQGKIDINFINNGSDGANWLHINSIQYNEVLDQIIISSRLLSEIYIIDHSTTAAEAITNSGGTYGQGGDFLYRWGNPQSYRQGSEDDRKLFGQHYPHVIVNGSVDKGKIMVFNNGFGRTPSFSEVFVLNPPTDSPGFYSYTSNTAFGPETIDYKYDDPTAPTDFFSPILSSAQRLPNDNILICEGVNGRIFEIDSEENKVWEYIIPINNGTGEIATQNDPANSIANFTFRAIKYSPDYAAFNGRDLTPTDPIELNPNLTPCSTLSISGFSLNEINIYPNPVSDILTIESTSTIDKIELYSILGAKVFSILNTNTLDLRDLNSGIYLLKIDTKGMNLSQKLIKR